MMRLKKFRIKNYKSIIDSGDCYPTDTVTIFAGKNESGKTSILEALEDFDTQTQIRETARPINDPKLKPEVSVTFVVGQDMIGEICASLGVDWVFSLDAEVELIKTFPDQYELGVISIAHELFSGKNIKEHRSSIDALWGEAMQICSKSTLKFDGAADFRMSDMVKSKATLLRFRELVDINPQEFEDSEQANELLNVLSKIDASILVLEGVLALEKKFIDEFKNWVPNFVLFSSFDDVFPNKIPFSELENNEWIKDLSVISNLNVATIKNASDREKKKHKTDINVVLNNDYQKFWEQDASELSVEWNSQDLQFWIQEDGYPYEPSMRSKGRQWHLAFYIKVTARAREDVPNIILIDEPGLFLHAVAQKDILNKLEDSAKEVQLMFSTHSPYLLEANKLNRVRLVHRTSVDGTKIENKVHALADKETLEPILTAIGLELSTGIANADRVNNVIVEGICDVYYLNAFKNILNKSDLNFVFGGGAGNMPFVGTILHGWGAKVVYLFDNDKGKKNGERNLLKHWCVTEELVLAVLDKPGSVEDLFSISDFKKLVLEDVALPYASSNSEYIKDSDVEKALIAKKFLEKTQAGNSIVIDPETRGNVVKIFGELVGRFSKI